MPALRRVVLTVRLYLVAASRYRQIIKRVSEGKMRFPSEHFAHAYILQSFYYADEFTEKVVIPNAKDFMLDSGAFSFMEGAKAVDWDEYVERYAAFINRNKVEKFFELDIDSVAGYEEVLRLRAKLEKLTGRQSIPVWHNNRGKDEFIRHAQEYPYVSIGGLVSGNGEYRRQLWRFFPWFIKTAHANGAKLHALGFTSLDGIERFHFDSVDSATWTTGNRFGHVFYFNGKTVTSEEVPSGYRIGKTQECALHNFCEWKKFQEYADKYL